MEGPAEARVSRGESSERPEAARHARDFGNVIAQGDGPRAGEEFIVGQQGLQGPSSELCRRRAFARSGRYLRCSSVECRLLATVEESPSQRGWDLLAGGWPQGAALASLPGGGTVACRGASGAWVRPALSPISAGGGSPMSVSASSESSSGMGGVGGRQTAKMNCKEGRRSGIGSIMSPLALRSVSRCARRALWTAAPAPWQPRCALSTSARASPKPDQLSLGVA